MALPSSDELSRWTVSQVSDWLMKCSLSVFREHFLADHIDGSKLMRLNPDEVNQRYKKVPSKKRNVLIKHLKEMQTSQQPQTRNVAPQAPPRLGAHNGRMPPPPPSQPLDDDDFSDDGSYSSEFDDDYLEPASKVPDEEPSSNTGFGTKRNHMLDGPEETYENPEIRSQRGLERKPTIAEKLRDELAIFKERNREAAEPAPPPRPPRSHKPGASDSPSMQRRFEPSHHHSPLPVPPVQNILPPEDTYEPMFDVINETQNTHNTVPQSRADGNFSPKPAVRGARDRSPEPPPTQRPAQKTRYAYTEVKKPGLQSKQDELSAYDWYHGKINRLHAQKIFEREQKSGMFLIRQSERDPKQPYTLMLWHCSRIWNIPIRKKDNGKYAAGSFKDGESEFATVSELVEHFRVASLRLKSDMPMQGSHTLTVAAPKH